MIPGSVLPSDKIPSSFLFFHLVYLQRLSSRICSDFKDKKASFLFHFFLDQIDGDPLHLVEPFKMIRKISASVVHGHYEPTASFPGMLSRKPPPHKTDFNSIWQTMNHRVSRASCDWLEICDGHCLLKRNIVFQKIPSTIRLPKATKSSMGLCAMVRDVRGKTTRGTPCRSTPMIFIGSVV